MTRHPLLLLILAGCYRPAEGEACVDVAEVATACPDAADVDVADAFVPMDCDGKLVRSVSGEGDLGDRPSQIGGGGVDLVCCYDAELIDTTPSSDCMVGRPLGVLAEMSHAPRCTRSAAWVQAGLGEHASIAAFARLALELMGHGAPSELVRSVLASAERGVGILSESTSRGAPAPTARSAAPAASRG